MPGQRNAWCCGASAMKLRRRDAERPQDLSRASESKTEHFVFLLLVLVSINGPADAQGTPSSLVGQEVDGADRSTTESFLSPMAGELEGENVTVSPLNFQQRENASVRVQETSVAKVATTEGILTSTVSSTRAAGVTVAQQPSTDQRKKSYVEQVDFPKTVFYYDYHSLRKWGLIAAAILFILGILILTCGKHGKSRCRGKKRTRNYDVTPA